MRASCAKPLGATTLIAQRQDVHLPIEPHRQHERRKQPQQPQQPQQRVELSRTLTGLLHPTGQI